MSTTPVYGFQAQLGIDTVSSVTHRFDFQSSTVGLDEEMKDLNGLRGTRSRSGERVVAGVRKVDGQIKVIPTANELALLLPWITGGTPSGSPTVTYPLGETVPTRYMVIDKVAKVMTNSGCCVDRWTARGSSGEALEMDLDIVGQDESVGNSGTFPSLSLDVANAPWMFYEAAISVNSTQYLSKDFTLSVDNALDKERFWNSQTLTAIVATDRHVRCNLMLAAGDAMAVYGLGAAGCPVVVTFTNGGAVLTLSMARVVFPRKPIQVSRPEIMIPMEGIAYKSGATLELVTTLNPGP